VSRGDFFYRNTREALRAVQDKPLSYAIDIENEITYISRQQSSELLVSRVQSPISVAPSKHPNSAVTVGQ